jgi:hypothetical protein
MAVGEVLAHNQHMTIAAPLEEERADYRRAA